MNKNQRWAVIIGFVIALGVIYFRIITPLAQIKHDHPEMQGSGAPTAIVGGTSGIISLFIVIGLTGIAVYLFKTRNDKTMLRTINHARFKVGQVWAYQTRPNEPNSTLIVLKTESAEGLGNIIHIQIQGLNAKNPHTDLGISSTIGHLPCSEACIDQSVTHVIQEKVPLPDYSDGYKQWREAFDVGKAGIWTIPVAEMVDAMEAAMNQS